MSGLLATWRAWKDRRAILSDLRRQAADASERNYFKVKDNLTFALSALERDDPRQAADLWTTSLQRYPNEARNSRLALDVLLRLRRFEEAEELMRQGQAKHPRDSYYAKGLVACAQARRDHEAVVERCIAMRKRFPGVFEGFSAAAGALTQLDRLEEAEAMAHEAMARFPDNLIGYLEYSRIAVRREDWNQALARSRVIQEKFNHLAGPLGAAQALIMLGRYDEAETLLSEARLKFPTDPGPLTELARCAQARGDTAEAVNRWKNLLHRIPTHIHSYFVAAEAFEALGERAEGEATLREAIDRFPEEPRPHIELAQLFTRRRDFPAAAQAWAALRQAFPDNDAGWHKGAEALAQSGQPEAAEALRAEHRARQAASP